MPDRREVRRIGLTAAQEGIWTGQEFDPESPAFNTAEYVEIHGPVDVALFERAVRTAVDETDALTVRFGTDGEDRAWQEVGAGPEWTMHVLDVSAAPDPVAAALDWMRADLAVPVDLRRGPVFAQALFRAGPEFFLWYQRVHHIALDGYGLSLVARRVAEVYTALVAGEEPPAKGFGALADVVAEDEAYRESPRFTGDRDYWVGKAQGKPAPVVLAHRTGPLAHRVVRETADLDATDLATCKAIAKDAGATWSEVLTAAFAAYLHRMAGAADLVFALPVMARIGSVSLRVPCMVTNVVPLWLTVEPGMSLADLTGKVTAELRAGRPHLRYRYEQLRRDLKLVASERKLFGPSVNIMPRDRAQRQRGPGRGPRAARVRPRGRQRAADRRRRQPELLHPRRGAHAPAPVPHVPAPRRRRAREPGRGRRPAAARGAGHAAHRVERHRARGATGDGARPVRGAGRRDPRPHGAGRRGRHVHVRGAEPAGEPARPAAGRGGRRTGVPRRAPAAAHR
jgi:hypothetical protein